MSIAQSLENFLGQAYVSYNLVNHDHTESAYDSARSADVSPNSVVKAILLRNRHAGQYVLALVPARNKLSLPWVSRELMSDLVLARETELAEQFFDCVLGAIPGFGQAYDLGLIWDDVLSEQHQLYFEAGDHEGLIKIDQPEFQSLFRAYPHGEISIPCESH